jgi:hypothetical protein
VIKAIIKGAYTGESPLEQTGANAMGPITSEQADAIVKDYRGLPLRTTSTDTDKGPLQNLSDLVGKHLSGGWTNPTNFGGFSYDLGDIYGTASFSLSGANQMRYIQRYREAVIRPLAAVGNTRVWNLMIDVVAQSGRYPASAKYLKDFMVDGEQRYWVHIAIDRLTGRILDKQVELVKE